MMSGVRGGLPPRPGLSMNPRGGGGSRRGGRQRDYRPVEWKMYFDEKLDVVLTEFPGRKFNVYENKCQRGNDGAATVVLLHGGGYSGLTWGPMAKHLNEAVNCRVLAVDLRGHGDTVFPDGDDETVLDADSLAGDVCAIVTHLVQDEAGPVILVGHSMGGALAVHTGEHNGQVFFYNIKQA